MPTDQKGDPPEPGAPPLPYTFDDMDVRAQQADIELLTACAMLKYTLDGVLQVMKAAGLLTPEMESGLIDVLAAAQAAIVRANKPILGRDNWVE